MKREWSDEDLAKLLGAVRAESSDAPLARALARLEAERLPAWCAWTTRPWALALSCLLLAVSLAGGSWFGTGSRVATGTSGTTSVSSSSESDPVVALLGEESSTNDASATAVDSGSTLR